MEVAMRWVVIAASLGGAAWYYGWFDRIIHRFPQTPPTIKSEPKEKPASTRRPRKNNAGRVVSGTDSGSAGDRGQPSVPLRDAAIGSPPGKGQNTLLSKDNDAETTSAQENRDFANALKRTQRGMNLTSASKQNNARSKARIVKQKHADADSSHASADSTAGTSSAGQDGDDETTPATSPTLKATIQEAVPDTTGVSDMLAPATDGPRTLKITGNLQQVQTKQTSAKVSEPAETKKQRQAKRKREEEKERIAQSNKEHEAKRQEQMRTARMAEGTSKQTKANAFKASSNAWTATSIQGNENAAKQTPAGAASSTPLDTFEPVPVSNVSSKGPDTAQPRSRITNDQGLRNAMNGEKTELGTSMNGASAASEHESLSEALPLNRTQSVQSWADEMDEDEQVKRVQEDDPSAWESVTSKKDKKKARKTDGETNGDLTRRVNGQAHPSAGNYKTNGTSKQQVKAPAENRFGSLVSEATSNEATSNEAQEETWEA